MNIWKIRVHANLIICLELKPDHMFGCILDRQACTPTFVTFRAILTPFKPNPIETARRSFTLEQFLRI